MIRNITLKFMTRELCHQYFQGFRADPAVFMDDQPFREYEYTREGCEKYFDRQQQPGRIYMAVMLDDNPIGELLLKNIDKERRSCHLSIHMQSDAVKNRGYGSEAERMALRYAFGELGMETVFADALMNNERSRHVLMKVGFRLTGKDDRFCYYRCDRKNHAAGPEKCRKPS